MTKIKLILSLIILVAFTAVCAAQDKNIYEEQGFTKIFQRERPDRMGGPGRG